MDAALEQVRRARYVPSHSKSTSFQRARLRMEGCYNAKDSTCRHSVQISSRILVLFLFSSYRPQANPNIGFLLQLRAWQKMCLEGNQCYSPEYSVAAVDIVCVGLSSTLLLLYQCSFTLSRWFASLNFSHFAAHSTIALW
jgi:hypothetical protein